MLRRRFIAAGASASALASFGVRAQQVTRLLVGATPGGGTDIVARALAQELTTRLGHQFIVENRPGRPATSRRWPWPRRPPTAARCC